MSREWINVSKVLELLNNGNVKSILLNWKEVKCYWITSKFWEVYFEFEQNSSTLPISVNEMKMFLTTLWGWEICWTWNPYIVKFNKFDWIWIVWQGLVIGINFLVK